MQANANSLFTTVNFVIRFQPLIYTNNIEQYKINFRLRSKHP